VACDTNPLVLKNMGFLVDEGFHVFLLSLKLLLIAGILLLFQAALNIGQVAGNLTLFGFGSYDFVAERFELT